VRPGENVVCRRLGFKSAGCDSGAVDFSAPQPRRGGDRMPAGQAVRQADVTKFKPLTPKSDDPPAKMQSKPLSPAAERALAEAAARRAERDKQTSEKPGEVNGPKGPDPVRYGDWEKKGIASDF
jgi:hypothetical protein